jgi:uncharacterized protein (TIGR00730 family)
MTMKRVCVFCGSNVGKRPEFAASAVELGVELAARGIELVTGGGAVGLMGVIADAVLGAGGTAVGVIPKALEDRELAHRKMTRLEVVPDMHTRKARMAELADGFIAMPGGFGTFDELFEIVTWAQLGIHEKPIGLLDVAGYYQPLLALVEHAVASGFVPAAQRSLLASADRAASLLDAMAAHQPIHVKKWLERPDL